MASDKEFEDDDQENFNESDETFGLPDIEYEPINREESSTSTEDDTSGDTTYDDSSYDSESSYDSYSNDSYDDPPPLEDGDEFAYTYEEESSSSVWPKVIIGLLIVAALGGGAYWYFMMYLPEQKAAENAHLNNMVDPAAEREKFVQDSLDQVRLAREAAIRDSIALANEKPAIGTIETLTGRTQRYYAIVASDIDDDLLLDYAKRLSKSGVSTKIIPPFGSKKFYRLAVAEGDTWQETAAKADELKSEYGSGVWVLKY